MREIRVGQSTNAVPTSSICSLRTHPAAFDPVVCCFAAGDVSCALGLFFFAHVKRSRWGFRYAASTIVTEP